MHWALLRVPAARQLCDTTWYLQDVGKGLKKRQSVSVMRTRLLCSAIIDTLRETEAVINEHARSNLQGQTVIVD